MRKADSRRVREKSRVASVGRHRRGRACAPRVTVLPPIGGEVFLPRSRLPFQPALPTVCSYKKLEDGDLAERIEFPESEALDRVSRKVRILRFPSVTGSRARRAFAMPGSWRATSRSVAGGVGLERGARGAPFLGGPVGDAAFRIQPNGDACAIPTTETRATHPPPEPARSGFVAAALGKPKLSRLDDRRDALARRTAPALAVEVRGTRGTSERPSTSEKARLETEEDVDMRPGDEEDGAWPEESAAARKARWAADAREAAAVRATLRAKEPLGAGAVGDDDAAADRESPSGRSRRSRIRKLESVAALWRMRGSKQRWGEEVPAAFRHLPPPPDPPHYGTHGDGAWAKNGHGQKTTRDLSADDERERDARVRSKLAKRWSKFVDDVADPEFGAWETDVSDLDHVDTETRRAGPKPTPVPAFEPRRKKGA